MTRQPLVHLDSH